MDDLKLISLVESCDELYNRSNPDYKSAEKKQEAWTMISHAMGYHQQDCVRRWTSLRDRFVREKRIDFDNRESGNVSATESKYRWPLMESMEFIAPHVAPRGKRILKKLKPEDISLPLVKTQESPVDPLLSYSPIPSPQSQQSQQQQLNPQSPQPSETTPEPEYTLAKKRKRNQEDFTETDKLFIEAVDTFKKICKTREQKTKKIEQDQKNENVALHSFGQMILATIGSMNNMNQAKAMKEVTEVVMRIKMESHTAEFNEFMNQFPSE